MKLFSSESIYNAKTDKWEERYSIDGILVDGDLYFFEMEREKELEANKLLKATEDEEYEYDCCDYCDCVECTIERYVEELQEITGGCPGCIRDVLMEFFCDIVEHIVIEDAEEDINRENKNLN